MKNFVLDYFFFDLEIDIFLDKIHPAFARLEFDPFFLFRVISGQVCWGFCKVVVVGNMGPGVSPIFRIFGTIRFASSDPLIKKV